MKKVLKILLVIVIAGAAGGFIYWQFIKKKVIRNSIEKTVTKKTDSLYYLHYDSSRIDEINGNATFYNVVLQSDSAQKIQLNSQDSLPNVLLNVRIKEVSASGVDIAGLLQQKRVSAKKILLLKPVIQIINTGANNPRPLTGKDTLELYEKILGKFNSIRADLIQVDSGTVMMTDRTGKPRATLENISIALNNFLVDSTKDYESIVSYFIKDVKVSIENIQLPESKNNTRINIEKVAYDAVKKSFGINALKQYQVNNSKPVTELKNIQITGLNTDAFILQQQLRAEQIACDGGLLTIYTKKKPGKSKAGDQTLELSTDIIDQAQIGGISLGSTKVVIINKDKPESDPFVLNNTRFKVTKIPRINDGANISNLISNAEWELSANGFSIISKNKWYKISVGDFVINNAASSVKIKNFIVKPLFAEQQFAKHSPYQNDLYNIVLNDISLSGVNFKALIGDKTLEAASASFQPVIKIFDDRTMPSSGKSKVGNYPQQQILKLPFPLYIGTVKINNAYVSYREKAIKSKLIGNVFFTNVNAVLNNVTNIPERIKINPLFKLNATGKFLDAADISTEWKFPLNATDGAFNISGKMAAMEATKLNPLIEPLAMASVKKGQIDQVNFTMDGTDTIAAGNILFLYQDLKMEMLKKGDDAELKKKGLISLLANVLIKNNNTDPSATNNMSYDRDTTKSFFNLVWKTIFAGVKKRAI